MKTRKDTGGWLMAGALLLLLAVVLAGCATSQPGRTDTDWRIPVIGGGVETSREVDAPPPADPPTSRIDTAKGEADVLSAETDISVQAEAKERQEQERRAVERAERENRRAQAYVCINQNAFNSGLDGQRRRAADCDCFRNSEYTDTHEYATLCATAAPPPDQPDEPPPRTPPPPPGLSPEKFEYEKGKAADFAAVERSLKGLFPEESPIAVDTQCVNDLVDLIGYSGHQVPHQYVRGLGARPQAWVPHIVEKSKPDWLDNEGVADALLAVRDSCGGGK